MVNIEARLHLDPRADKSVSSGVIEGVINYFEESGFKYNFRNCGWKEAEEIAKKTLNPRGQIDSSHYISILSVEKMQILGGDLKDRPHWDVVIASQDICPSMDWNFCFGVFTGCGRQNPGLSSVLISTHRLSDRNEKVGYARGKIVGYHEASHQNNHEHCENRRCVYYHSLGGLGDIDTIASELIRTGYIPKCSSHR